MSPMVGVPQGGGYPPGIYLRVGYTTGLYAQFFGEYEGYEAHIGLPGMVGGIPPWYICPSTHLGREPVLASLCMLPVYRLQRVRAG